MGLRRVARLSLLDSSTTELVASDQAQDAEPEFVWEVWERRLRCLECHVPGPSPLPPVLSSGVCGRTPAVHEACCDEEHGADSLACAGQAQRVSVLPGFPVALQLHGRGGGSE